MRKLALALSLLAAMPCSGWAAAPKTAVLAVQNMTCSLCPVTVRKALAKTPGVIGATVDYAHKTATVKYDPDKTTPAALIAATTNAGFPSRLQSGGRP